MGVKGRQIEKIDLKDIKSTKDIRLLVQKLLFPTKNVTSYGEIIENEANMFKKKIYAQPNLRNMVIISYSISIGVIVLMIIIIVLIALKIYKKSASYKNLENTETESLI